MGIKTLSVDSVMYTLLKKTKKKIRRNQQASHSSLLETFARPHVAGLKTIGSNN